jgi:CMP/dCMP kinase
MVIAIDGPAGAGKSTVARALAQRLGFTYLDSGAMYRCVGLLALAHPEQSPAVLAGAARIELGAAVERVRDPQLEGRPQACDGVLQSICILLDGRDVTEEIRAPEISQAASRVAADPGVREALVAAQRELLGAGNKDWVAEGRDIATVVAPGAELKVYLTADPAERARRRAAELGADPSMVMAEQALRDQRDSTLGRSTLQPAPGAIELDTTGLSVERVVDRIAALVADRRG